MGLPYIMLKCKVNQVYIDIILCITYNDITYYTLCMTRNTRCTLQYRKSLVYFFLYLNIIFRNIRHIITSNYYNNKMRFVSSQNH